MCWNNGFSLITSNSGLSNYDYDYINMINLKPWSVSQDLANLSIKIGAGDGTVCLQM